MPQPWTFAALIPFLFAQPVFGQAALINQYCVGCHNQRLKTGGVALEGLDPAGGNSDVWERVLRQTKSGQMPPVGLPRPSPAAIAAFAKSLEETLDRAAALKPDPGAPMPHRMNRTEYSNAIRDLLAIDTNSGAVLPVDDSGSGFDNMANLLSLSPVLLERYLASARTISRLAVGDLKMPPAEHPYGSRGRSQNREPNSDDLPFGSRGGIVVRHYFPLDAEYEIRVALAGGGDDAAAPTPHLLRLPVKAGLHTVAATFLRESARAEVATPAGGRRGFGAPAPADTPPAELDLRLDGARLKRFQTPQRGGAPDTGVVTIAGPFNPSGRGNTPSRAKIFLCQPAAAAGETDCARTILANLSRRAFRRPVTEADLRPLLSFYREARADGGDFEEGIQSALQAILVSPDFLFRVERDPRGAAPGSAYRIDGYALASRLSFFLWSSIPDEQLLQAASEGKLGNPAVLRGQAERMMADPKSGALISNFGSQWLYLRTLANSKPDPDIFAGFDENLRQAFQRETELFLASIFREDRSVLELLDANYTYLNQRLAEHYRIPNVYGSHFRRVVLPDSNRGGLLGQGSVLTVTSYPNRTSVVMRGKWILENLLGSPPPPPPAAVPELKPKAPDGRALTLRESMQEHRSNAICAGCHARMDPIGFALENFNGVGEWRATDAGRPIDASGKFPNGAEFNGPAGLKKLLLERHREEFIETVTEKLLTYALGRSVEAPDRPAVRAIARAAARGNYRPSAFLTAIVESVPFQMRRASAK